MTPCCAFKVSSFGEAARRCSPPGPSGLLPSQGCAKIGWDAVLPHLASSWPPMWLGGTPWGPQDSPTGNSGWHPGPRSGLTQGSLATLETGVPGWQAVALQREGLQQGQCWLPGDASAPRDPGATPWGPCFLAGRAGSLRHGELSSPAGTRAGKRAAMTAGPGSPSLHTSHSRTEPLGRVKITQRPRRASRHSLTSLSLHGPRETSPEGSSCPLLGSCHLFTRGVPWQKPEEVRLQWKV